MMKWEGLSTSWAPSDHAVTANWPSPAPPTMMAWGGTLTHHSRRSCVGLRGHAGSGPGPDPAPYYLWDRGTVNLPPSLSCHICQIKV